MIETVVSAFGPIASMLYDVAVVLLTNWRLIAVIVSIASIIWSCAEGSIFGAIFGVIGLFFSIFIKWDGEILGT